MRYSLESGGLWDHSFSDRITTWTKSNVKCKGYIGRMCFGHIQQELQAVKTDWPAHDLLEWLKKRYTLQNTASNWATITSIDELTYCGGVGVPQPGLGLGQADRQDRE